MDKSKKHNTLVRSLPKSVLRPSGLAKRCAEALPRAQLLDKTFLQVGDQKAAVSQKICPAESRAGRKITAACYHHAPTCSFMRERHQEEGNVAQGLQDNKHR